MTKEESKATLLHNPIKNILSIPAPSPPSNGSTGISCLIPDDVLARLFYTRQLLV